MIRTGADIKSAVIMKEIELAAGKNLVKGLIPAIKKVKECEKTNTAKKS